MRVKKAVIPAAGLGTRMLPATKTVPKEMLPLVDKPVIQYIIEDEGTAKISKFECEYRATKREEITKLLYANGCREVIWEYPEKTGFYQPVVIARKGE